MNNQSILWTKELPFDKSMRTLEDKQYYLQHDGLTNVLSYLTRVSLTPELGQHQHLDGPLAYYQYYSILYDYLIYEKNTGYEYFTIDTLLENYWGSIDGNYRRTAYVIRSPSLQGCGILAFDGNTGLQAPRIWSEQEIEMMFIEEDNDDEDIWVTDVSDRLLDMISDYLTIQLAYIGGS